MQKKITSPKGSITALVAVTVIIILIVLVNLYIYSNNKDTSQEREIQEVEKAYDTTNINLQDEYMNIISKSKANEPKISQGMIPIKYDETKAKWIICATNDSEWFSYTTKDKKWANIMLCDGKYNTETPIGTEVAEADLGSMFVWIPRYAYKITEGYHQNQGSIDVVWAIDNTYNYYNEVGDIKKARNGNEVGVITSTGYTDYVVHPAFTNGNTYGTFDNGEWKEEITGIWVAKFQAGFATTSNDISQKVTIASSDTSSTTPTSVYYPIFKGRKYAYNYVTPSQCFDISQAIDDNGNPYGLTTASNSHLMKSSEWGAVVYLSVSKYGYSEGNSSKEKAKNNLGIVDYDSYTSSLVSNPNNSSWKIIAITGYSAPAGKTPQNVMTYSSSTSFIDVVTGSNGKSYAWNNVLSGSDAGDGTKSSTTGNIYGIYDMGGCLADYTSSYINVVGNSHLTTYGGRFATGTSTYLATAYPYQIDTEVTYKNNNKDFDSAYLGFGKIFGDAIWETSSATGDEGTWFGQKMDGDYSNSEVFFPRGGGWNDMYNVGLFSLFDNFGVVFPRYGFHSILIVE